MGCVEARHASVVLTAAKTVCVPLEGGAIATPTSPHLALERDAALQKMHRKKNEKQMQRQGG
jgi:hypothetical protein